MAEYLEYLNTTVTFLVGLVALVVYRLSKRTEKRNAAVIILMDIRHAEQVASSIRETMQVDRHIKTILYENNWEKYKHLFASDFAYDDFVALNRFFDSCSEIAQARLRMQEVFYAAVKAKATIMQEKIFSSEDPEAPISPTKALKWIELINKDENFFDPEDPKRIVRKHLSLMGTPSTSLAFHQLRKTAGSTFKLAI